MGARSIRMPDVGEGVAEAEIVEWSVKVGDLVREDQVVAAVMTDKATVEIPTPVAGTVVALGGGVGDVLAVGAELIRIDAPGLPDSPRPPAPKGASPKPPPRRPQPAKSAPPSAAPSPSEKRPPSRRPRAAAPPRAALLQRPGRSASAGRREAARFACGAPAGRARPASTRASCAAPGRRAGSPTTTSTPSSPDRPQAPTKAPGAAAEYRLSRRSRSSGLRRRIAQNMAESSRRVAHFSYVEEVDVTALEELRAALNARATAERPKLTMLPFLMLAIVKAVADFPQVNAHYDDDNEVVERFGAVHLGVATQTSAGLMVPVVRHAETLGL